MENSAIIKSLQADMDILRRGMSNPKFRYYIDVKDLCYQFLVQLTLSYGGSITICKPTGTNGVINIVIEKEGVEIGEVVIDTNPNFDDKLKQISTTIFHVTDKRESLYLKRLEYKIFKMENKLNLLEGMY